MSALIVATSRTPVPDPGQPAPRIDYVELARRLGGTYIDYNAVPARRALLRVEERLGLDVQQAIAVAKYVRRNNIEVVFSLSERVGIPLALLLPRTVRHVVLGHHLLSRQKLALLRLIDAGRRWSTTIVPTHADARALSQALGLPADRVRMMFNTIDTRFFVPRPHGDESPYIISLGRAHRDYPTLIDALRRVPQVRCYVGANSTWIESKPGVADALPPNAVPQPYLSSAELQRRYAGCSFVVLPLQAGTTHWSAGTNTVMQAQAMGRPIIASRNPGIADYVVDGQNGVLVEGGDPAAMAAAIAELWSDPERARRMGRNARDWAEQNYSLDCWFERIESVLWPSMSGAVLA